MVPHEEVSYCSHELCLAVVRSQAVRSGQNQLAVLVKVSCVQNEMRACLGGVLDIFRSIAENPKYVMDIPVIGRSGGTGDTFWKWP